MKRPIRKWVFRLITTLLLLVSLLLIIILNPALAYANKTTQKNYSVFHNEELSPSFFLKLAEADDLLKGSELYTPELHIDICLNDGSKYPTLVRTLRGQAFAWGFYDKVVLQGKANYDDNTVELNGYKWNLTELLAHEMTHCLQFSKLGLWKSNPIGDIPLWKWEGYAEYVSRQNADQRNLSKNIERLNSTNKNDWGIKFADSTIAPREYFDYWILIQYCMDIKKMTFQQILTDTVPKEKVRQQMIQWYELGKTR